MGLKKCPICGEKYADIYKRCPFCEEEKNPRRAKQPRRYDDGSTRRFSRQNRAYDYEVEYEDERSRPIYEEEERRPSRRREAEGSYRGRRVREEEYEYEDEAYDEYDDGYDEYEDEDRGSPWFKVVMVILIAIIIACLLYLGRGFIADFFAAEDDDGSTSSSDMIDDPHKNQGDSQNAEDDDNAVVPPDVNPNAGTRPEPDTEDEQGNQEHSTTTPVTGTLELSAEDVTIQGDETFRLTAAGGGEVTYTSQDPAIASVSSSGTVTGLKKGITEIVVKRGSDSAKCIVRVKSNGTGAGSGASENGSAAESSKTAKLNKEDITIAPGEKVQLQVSGVTTALSWSVGKSSVAAVDQNGLVTGVASGKTTVTVKWDGQSRQCIVRVK